MKYTKESLSSMSDYEVKAQVGRLRELHCGLTNADMVFDDETHNGYSIISDQLEEVDFILGEPAKRLVEIKAQVALDAINDCDTYANAIRSEAKE